jgi:hypothetical protein
MDSIHYLWLMTSLMMTLSCNNIFVISYIIDYFKHSFAQYQIIFPIKGRHILHVYAITCVRYLTYLRTR